MRGDRTEAPAENGGGSVPRVRARRRSGHPGGVATREAVGMLVGSGKLHGIKGSGDHYGATGRFCLGRAVEAARKRVKPVRRREA